MTEQTDYQKTIKVETAIRTEDGVEVKIKQFFDGAMLITQGETDKVYVPAEMFDEFIKAVVRV